MATGQSVKTIFCTFTDNTSLSFKMFETHLYFCAAMNNSILFLTCNCYPFCFDRHRVYCNSEIHGAGVECEQPDALTQMSYKPLQHCKGT